MVVKRCFSDGGKRGLNAVAQIVMAERGRGRGTPKPSPRGRERETSDVRVRDSGEVR